MLRRPGAGAGRGDLAGASSRRAGAPGPHEAPVEAEQVGAPSVPPVHPHQGCAQAVPLLQGMSFSPQIHIPTSWRNLSGVTRGTQSHREHRGLLWGHRGGRAAAEELGRCRPPHSHAAVSPVPRPGWRPTPRRCGTRRWRCGASGLSWPAGTRLCKVRPSVRPPGPQPGVLTWPPTPRGRCPAGWLRFWGAPSPRRGAGAGHGGGEGAAAAAGGGGGAAANAAGTRGEV